MHKNLRQKTILISLAVVSLASLYLTINTHYLLFHSLVEIFSILIAFCVFLITWNTRKYIRNSYLMIIGIAYLFIGSLDLLHTLSYKGMQIFTDYSYYANQLWIGARYMESLTLLISFLILGRSKRVAVGPVVLIYAALSMILVLSIFVVKIFPVCFIENQGQTRFKQISEYVIGLILLSALFLLRGKKDFFNPIIYRYIFLSIVFTIISELAFAFYISNYGISNVIGHYFKLFSFYLIYRAIIQTGIKEPSSLYFREIDSLNAKLKYEIGLKNDEITKNKQLIDSLNKEIVKVKQLKGLLPICMNCKKIRDDKGYWNQLEVYISSHSEADFSHSLCPECASKLYPELDD